MKRMVILTAFTLLSGAAAAQSTGEKLGVNSALGIAPSTQDFVTEATNSGQFEIQSSQLAQQRGDAAAKSFAAQMIADHQKLDAELTDLIKTKAGSVNVPTGMSESQQSMMNKLKTLQGADFDKEYRDDQYSAHRNAVSLFQRYAKGGENADLKNWAQQSTAILQRHLDMAHDMNGQAMK
jgi:putative membrane protein